MKNLFDTIDNAIECLKRLKMDITITNDVCIFFDGQQYHDLDIELVKEELQDTDIIEEYCTISHDEDGFRDVQIDWDLFFYENEYEITNIVYEKFIKSSK